MLRKNNFLTYFIIALIFHGLILFYPIFAKNAHIFMSAPIDVTFYTPVQHVSNPQPVQEQKEEVKEPEPVKEEVKKEEPIKKEDIVVKAKEKKPKTKPKQKPQPKKTPKKEEKKEEEVVKQPEPAVQPQVETVQPPPEQQRYAATGGAQFENVSFDAQNFKYAYYTSQIIKKIGREWRWADSYGKLRALVYFKIHRDGTAAEIAIAESSGNAEYDKYALDTVQRASAFPPLPDGYSGDTLGVYFEFKYRN